MGNTISTPSSPHGVSSQPSQQQQKPSSTKSLRKMTSSTSLKLYRHTNRSETSLSSKVLASPSHQFGEKILDISKPTKFEHGIHVEYNRDSGKYMVMRKNNIKKACFNKLYDIGFT